MREEEAPDPRTIPGFLGSVLRDARVGVFSTNERGMGMGRRRGLHRRRYRGAVRRRVR